MHVFARWAILQKIWSKSFLEALITVFEALVRENTNGVKPDGLIKGNLGLWHYFVT